MSTELHPKFPIKEDQVYALTTYDQVSGSPSKLKYKFGSEMRFPSVAQRNKNLKGCYDIPTTKTNRAAGFGIGDRFAEIGKRKNPSPDTYKINSLFNPNATTSTFCNHMKGKKTYSFGTGRDSFTSTVVNDPKPAFIGADRIVPGPQEYSPLKPLGQDAVAFKLKQKLDYFDVARLARKQGLPGPGTYEDQTAMHSEGKYSSTEFNNSKAARWARDEKLKMPTETCYKNPGPGYHESLGNIADNLGYQTASQFHSIQTRHFPKCDKPSYNTMFMDVHKTKYFNPGPGSYQPPSDFGYVTLSPANSILRSNMTQKIYKQPIPGGAVSMKNKRRSCNPISLNSIIGQAEQLNNHMSSQPLSPSPRQPKQQRFNAWKTLQDFSPARRNRNATGLHTKIDKTNYMLSPLNVGQISDQMRDEMSKTPTYRTDIPLNSKNVNSMMFQKGSGAELNRQLQAVQTDQKMVQIIENDSIGKGANISDFSQQKGVDKSTTAGGRSSYDDNMTKNPDFMIQAKQLFDKEENSM